MNESLISETIQKLTAPFFEKGFVFEYSYQKGGDSSCVYICRYKKGRDFFDWREVSGAQEIHIVVNVNGEFKFPSLKYLFPKEHRVFKWKHLFRKPTYDEKRAFVASLLCKELASGKPDFFGIKL